MFRRIVIPIVLALLVPGLAHAGLKVCASTTDLASIAASVGGPSVEVFAIARPSSDPHRIEALPSHMLKVARAQVYLRVGLGLDPWADALVDGSRNAKLVIVDCSRGVRVLEKPTGKVDASMGDVHPDGNPHYWLDPRNGAIVARTVAEAFARVDPANAAAYRARAEAFAQEAAATWKRTADRAARLTSRQVYTYHRSWTYFADAFGLEVLDTVEPVPGIPPTARHLADLVAQARARKVAVLIQEPYFPLDGGRFLTREANVRQIVQAASCESGTAGAYLSHFDVIMDALSGGK